MPYLRNFPVSDQASPSSSFISNLPIPVVIVPLTATSCIGFIPRENMRILSIPVPPVFLLFISIAASTASAVFPPAYPPYTASLLWLHPNHIAHYFPVGVN